MLQQPPRSADDDVAPAQPTALELEVLPADDEAGAEVVVPAHGAHLVEDLVGQLAGGGQDQGVEDDLVFEEVLEKGEKRMSKRQECV